MEDIPLDMHNWGLRGGRLWNMCGPVQRQRKAVLTANRAGEAIEEHDDLSHGVFTDYWRVELKGNADVDGDGIVTTDAVYSYLSIHDTTGPNQYPVKRGSGRTIDLGRIPF